MESAMLRIHNHALEGIPSYIWRKDGGGKAEKAVLKLSRKRWTGGF